MKKCLLLAFALSVSLAQSQIAWSPCTGYFTPVQPINMTVGPGGNLYMVYGHPQYIAGILTSTNNGINWTELQPTDLPTSAPAYDIVYSGNNLLAISGNSVVMSSNSGTNWTAISSSNFAPNTDLSCMTVMPNGDVYLAGSENNGSQIIPHLYKSTNNGSNWTEITMSGIPAAMEVPVEIIASNPTMNSYLIMTLKNMSTMAGAVYWSSNGGVNWTAGSSLIASNNFFESNSMTQKSNGDIYIAGTELAPSGIKIFKSSNMGQTWSAVNHSGLGLTYAGPLLWTGNRMLLAGGTNATQTYAMYYNDASVVGIPEIEPEQTAIFPNPSNGLFKLNTELKKLSITDPIGRVVFESVSEQTIIDLQNLAAGVYFMQAENGSGGREFKQLIIAK